MVKYKQKENMAAAIIKTTRIGASNTIIMIQIAFDITLDSIQFMIIPIAAIGEKNMAKTNRTIGATSKNSNTPITHAISNSQ